MISPPDCLSAGWLIPTCLPASFSGARAADAVPGNLGCPTLRDSQGRGGCSRGAGCLVIHTAKSLRVVTVKGRLAFSALNCCFSILTPAPGQTLHRPWGPRRPRGHLAGRAGNSALDRGAAGVQRESRSLPREEEKTSPSWKSAVWSLGRAAPARATALGRVPSSFIQGTCAEPTDELPEGLLSSLRSKDDSPFSNGIPSLLLLGAQNLRPPPFFLSPTPNPDSSKSQRFYLQNTPASTCPHTPSPTWSTPLWTMAMGSQSLPFQTRPPHPAPQPPESRLSGDRSSHFCPKSKNGSHLPQRRSQRLKVNCGLRAPPMAGPVCSLASLPSCPGTFACAVLLHGKFCPAHLSGLLPRCFQKSAHMCLCWGARPVLHSTEHNWTLLFTVSVSLLEGSSINSYSLLQPHCVYSTNMC